MTNDEIRMTNQCSNDQTKKQHSFRHLSIRTLVIDSSFEFRHSSFPPKPSHPQLIRNPQHFRHAPRLRRTPHRPMRFISLKNLRDLPDRALIRHVQQ
jgi:hypothetical protein